MVHFPAGHVWWNQRLHWLHWLHCRDTEVLSPLVTAGSASTRRKQVWGLAWTAKTLCPVKRCQEKKASPPNGFIKGHESRSKLSKLFKVHLFVPLFFPGSSRFTQIQLRLPVSFAVVSHSTAAQIVLIPTHPEMHYLWKIRSPLVNEHVTIEDHFQ